MMNCFIIKGQPKSYNSWKRSKPSCQAYLQNVVSSFQSSNTPHQILTGNLYGLIYYFFKEDKRHDADNLSKPVWDCLTSVVYSDDNQIKLRIAGTFDLKKFGINQIDLTRVPVSVIGEFLDALDNDDHFIYVECGTLSFSHFQFNIQTDEI